MAQQSIAQIRAEKPAIVHDLVQQALRTAATASTPNRAIDVLGEALLALERLIGRSPVQAH